MDKIYKKKCKLCGKVIKSLSEQQTAYNYTQHYNSCKRKFMERAQKEKNGHKIRRQN